MIASDVFDQLLYGAADYAVVPYRNSTNGPIEEVWKLLGSRKVSIQCEIGLPIELALVSHENRIENITVVFSHKRRAFLIASSTVGLLSLRFFHFDTLINFVLLISLLITIEVYFWKK